MKLRLPHKLQAALIATLASVAFTTLSTGTTAQAWTLDDAALKMYDFTQASVDGASAAGWTFTNTVADEDGVFSTTLKTTNTAITHPDNWAGLIGTNRVPWAGVITINVNDLSNANGVILNCSNAEGTSTGMGVGYTKSGSAITYTGFNGTSRWGDARNIDITNLEQYADANGLVTVGVFYTGTGGMNKYVEDQFKTSEGLRGTSTTQNPAMRLSNVAGVAYTNLYVFAPATDTAISQDDMQGLMKAAGAYYWNGSAGATWSATSTNWTHYGSNVGMSIGAGNAHTNVVFGADGVKDVAVAESITVGDMDVEGAGYAFTVADGAKLTVKGNAGIASTIALNGGTLSLTDATVTGQFTSYAAYDDGQGSYYSKGTSGFLTKDYLGYLVKGGEGAEGASISGSVTGAEKTTGYGTARDIIVRFAKGSDTIYYVNEIMDYASDMDTATDFVIKKGAMLSAAGSGAYTPEKTLHGEGTYALASGASALNEGLSLSTTDWTGTVRVSGVSNAGLHLDTVIQNLRQGDSWVEFSNVAGYLGGNVTCAGNLILTNTADAVAMQIIGSVSGNTTELSGNIKGTGDIERSIGNGNSMTFSGDISGWTGTFYNGGAHSGGGYTPYNSGWSTLNFTRGGEIKASFVNKAYSANCILTLNFNGADTIVSGDIYSTPGASQTPKGVVVNVNADTTFTGTVNVTTLTVAQGKTATMATDATITGITNNGTLEIAKEKTLTFNAASYNANFGKLKLNDGATLLINNQNRTETHTIGSITLADGATGTINHKEPQYNAKVNIGTLVGDSDSTLNLWTTAKVDLATVYEMNGGDGSNFNGTIVLSQKQGGTRRLAMNINSGAATQLQNAIVKFSGSGDSNAQVGLGVHAENVTVKGIVSDTPNGNHYIFSGAAASNSNANFDTLGDSVDRTLTINTGDSAEASYSTRAWVGSHLSIVKEGEGTQTFSGNVSAFNGALTVNSGTLAFTGTGGISTTSLTGTGGTLDVTGTLAVANAEGNEFSGTLAVGGLTKSGDGTLTLHGITRLGSAIQANAGSLVVSTGSYDLAGLEIVRTGAVIPPTENGYGSYNGAVQFITGTGTYGKQGDLVFKHGELTAQADAFDTTTGQVTFTGAETDYTRYYVNQGTVNYSDEFANVTDFNIAAGATLAAANGNAYTTDKELHGAGTYALAASQQALNGGLNIGSDWTGVVRITGTQPTNGWNLATLDAIASTIEFAGVSTFFSDPGTSLDNPSKLTRNVIFTNAGSHDAAVYFNDGFSRDGGYEFSGSVSGSGTFHMDGRPTYHLTFSGDVSNWNGLIKVTNAGSGNDGSWVRFSDNAQTVNVEVNKTGGTFRVIADTDATFNKAIVADALEITSGHTATVKNSLTSQLKGAGNLKVDNNGYTATVTGATSYTGAVTVAADGKLDLNAAVTLGGAVTVEAGGTLDLNAADVTLGALTLDAGESEGTGGAMKFLQSSALTVTGNLSLGANSVLDVTNIEYSTGAITLATVNGSCTGTLADVTLVGVQGEYGAELKFENNALLLQFGMPANLLVWDNNVEMGLWSTDPVLGASWHNVSTPDTHVAYPEEAADVRFTAACEDSAGLTQNIAVNTLNIDSGATATIYTGSADAPYTLGVASVSGSGATLKLQGASTTNVEGNTHLDTLIVGDATFGGNTIVNLADSTITTLTNECGTVTVAGVSTITTLNAKGGTTTVTGTADTKATVGTLNISNAAATAKFYDATFNFSSGDQSIKGNVTIGSGATGTVTGTDSWQYAAGSDITIEVDGGTLAFGNKRWTVHSHNKLILKNGAKVTGAGEGTNGALDFDGGSNVLEVTDGTADVSAAIRFRNNTTKLDVADQAVLTLSGTLNGGGSIEKTGLGELVISSNVGYTGSTIVSAGTLTVSGTYSLNNANQLQVKAGAEAGFTGTVNIGTNGTFSVAEGATLTFGGTVAVTTTNPDQEITRPEAGQNGFNTISNSVTVGAGATGGTWTLNGYAATYNATAGTVAFENQVGTIYYIQKAGTLGSTIPTSNITKVVVDTHDMDTPVDLGDAAYTAFSTLQIDSGVVTTTHHSGDGVVKNGNIVINAGGTFRVAGQHDAFGYNNPTTTITLNGAEGNLATLDLCQTSTGSVTMKTNLVLNGHTLITDNGTHHKGFNTFGGSITVAGEDNRIEHIDIRENVTVTVGDNAALSIGKVTLNMDSGNKVLTKAEAGSLTFTGDAAMYGLNINAGSVSLNGGAEADYSLGAVWISGGDLAIGEQGVKSLTATDLVVRSTNTLSSAAAEPTEFNVEKLDLSNSTTFTLRNVMLNVSGDATVGVINTAQTNDWVTMTVAQGTTLNLDGSVVWNKADGRTGKGALDYVNLTIQDGGAVNVNGGAANILNGVTLNRGGALSFGADTSTEIVGTLALADTIDNGGSLTIHTGSVAGGQTATLGGTGTYNLNGGATETAAASETAGAITNNGTLVLGGVTVIGGGTPAQQGTGTGGMHVITDAVLSSINGNLEINGTTFGGFLELGNGGTVSVTKAFTVLEDANLSISGCTAFILDNLEGADVTYTGAVHDEEHNGFITGVNAKVFEYLGLTEPEIFLPLKGSYRGIEGRFEYGVDTEGGKRIGMFRATNDSYTTFYVNVDGTVENYADAKDEGGDAFTTVQLADGTGFNFDTDAAALSSVVLKDGASASLQVTGSATVSSVAGLGAGQTLTVTGTTGQVLTLSANNTMAGTVAVQSGTLKTTAATALGNAHVDVAADGTLELGANLTLNGGMDNAGTISMEGKNLTLNGTTAYNLGTITGNNNTNLFVNANANAVFTGNATMHHMESASGSSVTVAETATLTFTNTDNRNLAGNYNTFYGLDNQGTISIKSGNGDLRFWGTRNDQVFNVGHLHIDGTTGTSYMLTAGSVNYTTDIVVKNLSGGSASHTLQVTDCYNGGTQGQVIDFIIGEAQGHSNLYEGKIQYGIGTSSAKAGSGMNVVLKDELVASKAVLDAIFSGNNAQSATVTVDTERAKVKGLTGTATATKTMQVSGTKAEGSSANRVLEITGEGSYTYGGKLGANLDVVHSGSGTQSFGGVDGFDGSIDVEGGVLNIKNAASVTVQNVTLGTGAVMGVYNGENVQIDTNSEGKLTIKTDKILTAGSGARLNANLEMESGSHLSVASGGLDMGSTVTLNQGMTLEGWDSSLGLGDSYVLFTGVDGLDLGYGLVIGEIGKGNWMEAHEYFTNIENSETVTYLLYYGGAPATPEAAAEKGAVMSLQSNGSNVGVVYIYGVATPEPTTGTLSLLALCALAARRRRK